MDTTPRRTWGSVVGDHLRDRALLNNYHKEDMIPFVFQYRRRKLQRKVRKRHMRTHFIIAMMCGYYPCMPDVVYIELFGSTTNYDVKQFPNYLWSCNLLDASFMFNKKELSGVYSHEAGILQAGLFLVYWALTREQLAASLQSHYLQLIFYFVEDSPVLCILEDFLPQLDCFFHNYRSVLDRYVRTSDNSSGSDSERVKDDAKFLWESLRQRMVGVISSRVDPVVSDLDEKYVEALEMHCLLKQRLLDVKHHWRTVVQRALCDHGKYKSFADSHYSNVIATLESLVLLSQDVLQFLSSHVEEHHKPKFVQLCHQLSLTEKEEVVLRFIFIHNVGVLFGKLHNRFSMSGSKSSLESSRLSSMALSAAAFSQMSSREMLEFMDRDRPHLKQEILEPEDEFSSLQTTSFIVMPTSFLKACCGCTLSAEDRFKIDKTAMGDIMSQGVTIAIAAASSEVLADSRDVGKKIMEGEEVNEVASENKTEVELEEILRSCNEASWRKSDSDIPLVSSAAEGQIHPYVTDLDYLEDNFQLIETLGKALKIEDEDDILFRTDQRKPEAVIREMRAKSRSLKAKISQKMEATKKLEGWLPRLERLAELRKLDQFEKNILLLLIGSMVSKNLRKTGNSGTSVFGHSLSIGAIISLFCEGLKEQIESRTYFYKNSKLVSEGLVHVSDPPLHTRGNFLDSVIELDRRLLDYIVGLDTEINELVDGSDLYTPTVSLDDVALPQDHKQLLLSTFKSFDQFQKTCKELGLSTKGTSKGLTLLFYGPSGTGKTMTANAVANYLNKKVLLISLSLVIDKDLTKELLRFLFREAKIHNAVLFFDECESLFESRSSRPNPTLGVLLTEVELYSGVIILATNRHYDMDEAMHRRIQLALPFSVPDFILREEIWKSHVPGPIASKDINWKNLALSYELTGGLICNAVLSALSLALKQCGGSEDEEQPILTELLLIQGAKFQLRGLLEMVDFERRIIPTFGIRDLVLEDDVKQQLNLVLSAGKTGKLISSQWGFGGPENVARGSGISVLICGPSGAGKTAIAKAIAYELGQPIKEATCTELLSHTVSMQTRTARGIAPFFREAERTNAIIVLDGSEILLSNLSSNMMSGVVGCEHLTLVHQVEHCTGVVLLISRHSLGQLDLNRLPRLKYVLNIASPSSKLREELWRKLLPKKAPTSSDIDYHELAERFSFNGGEIASSICQAAELCASASTPPLISHHSLQAAAEFQMKRIQQRNMVPSIFS